VLRATCFDILVLANNLLFMAGYKAGRSAMENSAPDTIIATASSTLEGTRHHHQQCVGLGIKREGESAGERVRRREERRIKVDDVNQKDVFHGR